MKAGSCMKTNIPRIMISALGSGNGKTTVVCGILKALKNRGVNVSAFKCGPDYIDPMFHTNILGISSKNLDKFFCDDYLIRNLFFKGAKNSDIAIIEGVMGYYDGVTMDSFAASSYDIARTLKSSVVLVINAKGMAFTVISIIEGIINFRNDSNIKAIIFNNISENIYLRLKNIIESKFDIEVVGYLPYNDNYKFESRHLGLMSPFDIKNLSFKIDKLGNEAEKYIDIQRIIEIASNSQSINTEYINKNNIKNNIKIGIALDNAFCFYYKDNIELLESLGCEIVFFSPLNDKKIPDNVSGVIFGGGYPELYCEKLSQNKEMLCDVGDKLNKGLPCIAECGGFMYLHKFIRDKENRCYNMVGIIDSEAFFCKKLVRFGYITLTAEFDSFVLKKGEKIKAHEFHYWDSGNNGNAFLAEKPSKMKSWKCIHQIKNIVCGYPHIFYYSNINFAKGFVQKCIEYRE